jgi:hypothetical protein
MGRAEGTCTTICFYSAVSNSFLNSRTLLGKTHTRPSRGLRMNRRVRIVMDESDMLAVVLIALVELGARLVG